ncbi:MAG: NADH-quinone oxidoreductase subunit N [Chitinophagales bacterium]|nr:NADH-quinone oxidoreductase subunit N [Chitinophagales bacterium]MCO5280635.1 NADH-quinone oxidoreductase subunit N [Chitinophagales bacterium]
MNALIYTSALGIICLLAEIFNLRKLIIPIAIAGLLAILGTVALDWNADNSIREAALYNMLRADSFSLTFSGLLISLTVLLLMLSTDFYKTEQAKISDYIALILFILAGSLAMASFGNLAMLFLGIEVLSISLYIMAGANKHDKRSNEAGMKYFLMGSFASGLLLFGIALVYGETGSFDIVEIRDFIATHQPTSMLYVGVGLMLMALLFKTGAAPFHYWAPDVYEGAPMFHTAILMTVAKIGAFAAFYRLFSACFIPVMMPFGWVLSIVVALTITVGNLSALVQDSFKRMLALSGVSNAGYLMIAIVTLYGKTDNAVFYYSLAYGMALITAFTIAIFVYRSSGTESFSGFNGLAKRHPFIAASLTIAMLSLAGIPPFAGFFGKYYIFSEAVRNGRMWLVIIATINSIIGVYYYLKVVFAMYLKESDSNAAPLQIPVIYSVVIAITLTVILAVGLFPSTVLGWL